MLKSFGFGKKKKKEKEKEQSHDRRRDGMVLSSEAVEDIHEQERLRQEHELQTRQMNDLKRKAGLLLDGFKDAPSLKEQVAFAKAYQELVSDPNMNEGTHKVLKDLEHAQKVDIDTYLNPKMLPGRALKAFHEAETIEQRVEAGQMYQEFLSDERLKPGDLQKIKTLEDKQGIDVQSYLELNKMMEDVRMVGKRAWVDVGGQSNTVTPKSITELSEDMALDETARGVAQEFRKYHPVYQQYKQNPEGPFDGLGPGESIGKPGTKVVIMKDGEPYMKPEYSDDPRLIDMLGKSIESVLTPGRTREQDERTGFAIAQTFEENPDSTRFMSNLNGKFMEKALQMSPERMTHIIGSGRQQLVDSQEQTRKDMERDRLKKEKGNIEM